MTLIEVLIASIILFMAIGLVTSAFQQSLLLQQKVMVQRDKIELTQMVKPMIQFELNQGKVVGNFDVLSKKIEWQAEIIAKDSFVDAFSEDGDDYVSGRGYVILYSIIVKQEDTAIVTFKYSTWSSS